jgi:ubiquinone/menaquinone biosynthesis C-methylase UbiE
MNHKTNKVIEFYTHNYDEDTRLARHRTEFITTTYILNKYIKAGWRILDLGAGTGIYTIYYANRGCPVTAIDIVPRHIEILNTKLKAFPNLDVTAQAGDAQDLSRFRDGSFDVVLCMGPLYNLKETGRCIKECLRVLKSKGILAASYGNKNESFEMDSRYKDLFIDRTPEEVEWLFHKYQIKRSDNVPTDGEPFAELDDLIKAHPDDMDNQYSWLEIHQSVFKMPDRFFLHGLYIGKKP